jgi:hypothetical protein
MNPLLGFVADQHALPRDEEDQRERSSKKVKDPDNEIVMLEKKGEGLMEGPPTKETAAIVSKTYKETVAGIESTTAGGEKEGRKAGTNEVMEDDEGMRVEGHIVEQKVGEIDCPIFSFSIEEEKRIQQPWKQGVIVKLLGRRIGYRALENRLHQLWVRRGVIQIVDLSHDFYLVTFTNPEDQHRALTEGPWMIYDHYLVVRPWSANFDTATATVNKTAVWVRFSGLPIEYYDPRILHFIGNRIGQTVKVDKNTLLQERGKYARLCVEVDLSKPLLAMFELKGRHYKVEYEGLHLLCLSCGRFDHYLGGCPNKPKPTTASGESEPSNGGGGGKPGDAVEGPWTVVQKQRRPRKGKEAATVQPSVEEQQKVEMTVALKSQGSRFALLAEENSRESETPDNNSNTINREVDNHVQTLVNNDKREKQTEKATNAKKKVINNNNKNQKINATRVQFKEKKGISYGKKSDKLAELMVTKEQIATHANPMNKGNVNDVVPILEPVQQNTKVMVEDNQLAHVIYHREPGINESKFFNGPMFGDSKPELANLVTMHPTNTSSSLVVEVFEDAKDTEETSAEEWNMEEGVDGANKEQMKGREANKLS